VSTALYVFQVVGKLYFREVRRGPPSSTPSHQHHVMSRLTRRTFLKTGSMAAAVAAIPVRQSYAESLRSWVPRESAPDFKALAAAALDAAKGAGATYADVHFRYTRKENWVYWQGLGYPTPSGNNYVGVGVRSLVNGYWGFSGMDSVATTDDAARLGRDSAAQARTAAKGKPRSVNLAPAPVVNNGSWVMPVEIDPFTVSLQEKVDYIDAMSDYVSRRAYGVGTMAMLFFTKEERIFASSEGSNTSQTVYNTSATFSLGVPFDWLTERPGGMGANFLTPAGAGWEYIRNAPYRDRADEMIEIAKKTRRPKPVEVGKYDIVFDPEALAGIIDVSIGMSTELDRATGYLANTVGTSYLNDPMEMLGTFKMGSALLNVSTNRSLPGGAATVKWDDEGVEPAETQLVTNGILTDYQTTRESASWIAEYYQKKGTPVKSNGCAGVYGGSSSMSLFNPNLVLHPGTQDLSFGDLVKSVKKGYAILGGQTYGDQQALNGNGYPSLVYEIKNGELGEVVSNAEVLYRSPEFWKNLTLLGGKSSVRQFGFDRWRDNDYEYRVPHTISTPAAKVTGVAITDMTRKA